MGDQGAGKLEEALAAAGMDAAQAEAIYRLTSLADMNQRVVIPPMLREMAVEAEEDPQQHKGAGGFGRIRKPKRRW